MSLFMRLAPHLPYLRRHVAALNGYDYAAGDEQLRQVLAAIALGNIQLDASLSVRAALYRAYYQAWDFVDTPPADNDGKKSLPCELASVFLLTALDGFTPSEAASILGAEPQLVDERIEKAEKALDHLLQSDILIIEGDVVQAVDIAASVAELGHRLAGIASTRAEAVVIAADKPPSLIIADIQLADMSSGIDAVRDILSMNDKVPVIFLTAFPERLLTGNRPEPTFVITKPWQAETLKAAIGQALFFAGSDESGIPKVINARAVWSPKWITEPQRNDPPVVPDKPANTP